MSDETLVINEQVAIPLSELSYRFARSGGPGGQHVQRTETKVELLFDLANSPSLTNEQRALVQSRLANRLDSDGVLHMASQAGRSQAENRADVTERFRQVLAAALKPRKRRKPTRPGAAARQRRLDAKKQRSQTKQRRRTPDSSGEM